MNLKRSLTQPLLPIPTKLAVAVLVVALLGFADAAYLTIEHYQGSIPPCSVVEGCEQVLTSQYATVLGVPVALGGAIFYFLVLVGAFAYLEGKHERLFRYALFLTFPAFVGTLWFLSLQQFVLNAYCLYCLGSALTSTALFVLAVYIFKNYRGPEAAAPGSDVAPGSAALLS